IGDGQLVAIDYAVGPEPANTTTTIGVGTSWRYDFDESFLKGAGVYIRYFHQDQDRTSSKPDLLLPANVDDLVVGADYRIGVITLSAEHQWHDSTLSPYNATRFNANYDQPMG